jgi:hypothetical protein
MGASDDEIDRQIEAIRDDSVLDEPVPSNAARYGRIAAVVSVGVVTGVAVLIYLRVNRRNKRQRLQRRLMQALKEIPDSLRDLPNEVKARLMKPLPSVKVVVNEDGAAREPGTLERIVRRIAPAVAGAASSAVVDRFTRSSERSAASARD